MVAAHLGEARPVVQMECRVVVALDLEVHTVCSFGGCPVGQGCQNAAGCAPATRPGKGCHAEYACPAGVSYRAAYRNYLVSIQGAGVHARLRHPVEHFPLDLRVAAMAVHGVPEVEPLGR